MKIGTLDIDIPVFLAPMAGVTDLPFRMLCREAGCGMVYSEMISAKGLYYENENTALLLQSHPDERPLAVQLFGSDPGLMAEMAVKIESLADVIDINMGCPAPKIVRNGEGSALMQKPALAVQIIRSVASAIRKPLTVKFRKGFYAGERTVLKLAAAAEEAGAAAVAVHGRTASQQYAGQADWSIIRDVALQLSIPVIGNGDIRSPEDAERMMTETSCAGVMIGRAAQGNPFLFAQCAHYFRTGAHLPSADQETKMAMALRHARAMAEYKGEYIGIREMRKHLAWYTRGFSGASELRQKINQLETFQQLEELLRTS